MASTSTDLLHSIRAAPSGLSLAELLAAHPGVARRTAQRWIAKLITRRSTLQTRLSSLFS